MNQKRKEMLDSVKWATCIPLIGGSAIGCSQTIGHQPEYHLSYKAFAFNEKQIRNYWPDVPYFVLDDEEFETSQLPEEEIDFVNAVCPCAGLSMLNIHASADAKQNDWLYMSTEFVLEHIKPKVLWGENAPGLSTTKGRPVAEKIAAIGRKYGYSYSMIKTNAMEHGLPQNRQRTFYFLWKSKTAPIIGYHHHKITPFHTYLSQIPKDATQQDDFYSKWDPKNSLELQFVLEKSGMTLNEFIKKKKRGSFCYWTLKYAKGPEGFITWLEKQPESPQRAKLIKFYKHIRNKFDKNMGFMDNALTFAWEYTNAFVGKLPGALIHPTKERFLSVREMLHIMGLPADFELIDWKRSRNIICQNVPVPTTRDFVKEVIRFCKKDSSLVFAPANFVVQNNCSKKVEEMKMIWK